MVGILIVIKLEDKMKKYFIILILLALSFGNFSCGGGAGSSDSPEGENSGIPSIIQVLPSHYIAQTNSYITIHAKVLDGNGAGVKNITVRFTNLSPVGVLSSTSAKTNNEGIATVTVQSNSVGFATIQAEVNSGVAIVRDYKTVFFSSASTAQLTPYLDLYVDGDGDLSFNEENDLILFQNENDNSVVVLAKVYNAASNIAGSTVTFGADRPYKIGSDPDATCSDGSDTCDVIFPGGNQAITNSWGEASVPVMFVPSALMPLPTTLNIYALADIGAFNIITLFLEPVTISRVSVSANPNIVESGGTSEIIAVVTTTAGTPTPDGTTVNFRILSGVGVGIDPFGQTTEGVATATYTAPALEEGGSDQTVTVEASVGSKKSTVQITVKAPPAEEE